MVNMAIEEVSNFQQGMTLYAGTITNTALIIYVILSDQEKHW